MLAPLPVRTGGAGLFYWDRPIARPLEDLAVAPRLSVRSGAGGGPPDAAVALLVADPEGTAGEQAVARLGAYCYEGDGAVHLVRTDGWAERESDGDTLRLAIAVYPVALRQVGVDPHEFTERSAVDPEALIVLRAQAAVPAPLAARLVDAVAVFTAGPDSSVDELLDAGEWPMMLAPPPED
ncbi:hypothetical protein ABZ439_23895 [Streptomyces sp. NPDC005840]|uniref:hypothetical protein n=1 Tax=Streptomyces sp. NPDC005840 TaxID=3157072 RepID=UPI0033D216A6